MKKLIYMLLAFFCPLSLSAAGTENIIPFVSVSASNSDGIMLSGNLVNCSGMSEKSLDATHDNASDGSTMWCSRSGVLGDVKLEDISDTLRQQVPLRIQKGVKFVPSSIEMMLPVDIYTEKTVEVPLRGVNFPADKVLRAFPSKVQVTFQVGLSHFRQINADDFHIYVSYEELLRLGSDKYTVKIKNLPKGVSQVRFNPAQVDFLIEQVSPDYGD